MSTPILVVNQNAIICLISTSRSGSTLVQHVLSTYVGVAALGEVRRFSQLLDRKAKCGCGQDLQDCSVWAGAAARVRNSQVCSTNELPKPRRRLSTFLDFAAVLAQKPVQAAKLNDRTNSFSAWNAKEIARKLRADILVDSSKDVGQFLHLARAGGCRLVPVHLVRDPRGVAWSASRRTTYRPDEMAKHWLRFNLAANMLRFLTGKYPWYFLRYEDFCSNPTIHCRGILRRAGQPEPELRTSSVIDHSIGGSSGFKVEDPSRLIVDERWKSQLAQNDSERVWARTHLLARSLGYCG